MKILKSFIAALFLTATFAMQAHGMKLTAEERALVITFRMSKYIQLTEAQKTEIMKIHQIAFEKMDIARQEFKGDRTMLLKSRKEIFATRDKELGKILSKEQFDIFKQKQKEQQEKMKKEMEARKAARALKNDTPPANKSGDKEPSPMPAPGK
jgi:hypothetical protein